MPTHHQIEVATRLGMLTRERDVTAACQEALHALGELIPADAATLVGVDPATGRHLQFAGIGYQPAISSRLAEQFVQTRWHRNILGSDLPESISDEAGQSFRQGWFYAENVRPAGFRDAMTGALRHRGRYVGLVNLSICRADVFDTECRRLLAAVMPALSALVDRLVWADDSTAVPEWAYASLITGDQVVEIPDRLRPSMLDDVTLRRLIAEFASWPDSRLSLLWLVGRDWFRVRLRHQQLAGLRPAVLVEARPTGLPHSLSPREIDVVTRAAMGHSNQVIAQELFLSPRTVHSHIEHILRKTGAKSRAEVAATAVRDDLVRLTPDMSPVACLRSFAKPNTPMPR
ncbi:LuxR C-terminal-related transcriptional regulator [Actinoplanes sp. NPDC026670]|uniref:helix-turn-helix transcriptional regulator n=1 Tax=Actinoplanes sp. NPDC026670 TaxID=3154700 RepID=UPI0033D26872